MKIIIIILLCLNSTFSKASSYCKTQNIRVLFWREVHVQYTTNIYKKKTHC